MVAALAAGLALMFFGSNYASSQGYAGYGMMGAWWPWMGLGMLLVVFASLFLLRWAMGSAGPASRSALDELDARYARGDIGREDYLRMKQDLRSRPPGQ